MISVKRPLILAASAALALMFSIVSANTLAATTTMRFPIVQTVFACDANGGMGEAVPMSGTALLVENLTMDSNGGFHAKFHLQAQNVTGGRTLTYTWPARATHLTCSASLPSSPPPPGERAPARTPGS